MVEPASGAEEQLAAAIAQTGARHAFGVPGGGANLDMVGALGRHGVEFVLAHGETAACIAASTYGYVSDTVTAAVVTRGPGAASAVNGAAQATLDRHPLVVVSDSVASDQRDRIAHQRIDQHAMFAPVTKATAVLTDGETSTGNVAVDAVTLAAVTPRGAVHLDQDRNAPSESNRPLVVQRDDTPSSADLDIDERTVEAERLLAGSDRPIVIVGVGADRADGLAETLQRFGAPVFTTYQAVGVVPTGSSVDAGLFTGGRPERTLLEQADLVVLVGLDMVEPIPASWPSAAPVVSLTATPTTDAYAPISVELVGDVGDLAGRLLTTHHDWPANSAADHRADTLAELRSHGCDGFGPLDVVDALAEWGRARNDVTLTVDAGAHFLAVMPFWSVRERRRLLISNGLATMGYAVPAAIGAALARPGEPAVAITGDGGLGMCLAELETIARLDLPITVVVFNDAALSLIRIKQQEGHGGEAAVTYRPTDFAAVARASGMSAVSVENAGDLAAAIGRSAAGPMLLDVGIDPSSYPHLIRVTRG